MTSTDVAEMIRAAGLRMTAPRQAVLEVLATAPGVGQDPAARAEQTGVRTSHPDVEQITAAARRRLGSVSHQAVYDVLSAFESAHLVRRVPMGSSAARYELDRHDNHHHLVCSSCGVMVDVPCTTGRAPCMVPADDHGFSVEQASVVFWGQCPACLAAHAQHHEIPLETSHGVTKHPGRTA